jgi:hypothetical protein
MVGLTKMPYGDAADWLFRIVPEPDCDGFDVLDRKFIALKNVLNWKLRKNNFIVMH